MGRVLYLDSMRASGDGGGAIHIDVPEWYDRALCPQVDNEPFFPDKGGSTKQAKKVCGQCEVREECLQYALDNDERWGVWGGLSERDRRKLKRNAQAPTNKPKCGAPAMYGPCSFVVPEEGERCHRHPRQTA